MKLEEYEQIMRTGTPSDRARAIAAANDDKELSEEELEEKATAAMAQLKENTWEKRISTP